MKAPAGANDTVKLVRTGGGAAYSEPSALSLSNAWTETEFNVVGDSCKSKANFHQPDNSRRQYPVSRRLPDRPRLHSE